MGTSQAVIHKMHVHCKWTAYSNQPLGEEKKPVTLWILCFPPCIALHGDLSNFVRFPCAPLPKHFYQPPISWRLNTYLLPSLPPYSILTSCSCTLTTGLGKKKKRQQLQLQVPASVQGSSMHALWRPVATCCLQQSSKQMRQVLQATSFALLKVILRIFLYCMLRSLHQICTSLVNLGYNCPVNSKFSIHSEDASGNDSGKMHRWKHKEQNSSSPFPSGEQKRYIYDKDLCTKALLLLLGFK